MRALRAWQQTGDGALTTAFLARFFDNEITAGTTDLKTSFFWLIAFLAAPGFLVPVAMVWNWSFVGTFYGADALRVASRAEKVLYLGYAMSATGILTAIVWQALLIDRRDALVLGTLPVSGRAIVRAKLQALVAYVLIVAVAMHGASAVMYGLALAEGRDLTFAVRGVVTHLLASMLASGWVVVAVTALQGALLMLAGPRGFRRLSPLLQLGLVAAAMLSLLALPTISVSVNHTLAGQGARMRPWVLDTPPAWFLGVYEVLLGGASDGLASLAAIAVAVCVVAGLLTAVTYPVVYRRVVVAAVEQPEASGRSSLASALARRAVAWLGRGHADRAALQFLLATMGRVERHRFAIATSIGLACAFAIPVLLLWQRVLTAVPADPPVPILILPVAVMLLLMAGLRVTYALPSDLRPAWLFRVARVPAATCRTTARRWMVTTCACPPVLLVCPFMAGVWGAAVAATHLVLSLAVGYLVATALTKSTVDVPCTRPWRPERANLRLLWPVYLTLFIAITQGVAALTVRLQHRPGWLAGTVAVLVATSLALQRWPVTPSIDATDDEPEVGSELLKLN